MARWRSYDASIRQAGSSSHAEPGPTRRVLDDADSVAHSIDVLAAQPALGDHHDVLNDLQLRRVRQARARRIDDARAARATAGIKAWREAEAFTAYASALRRRLSTHDPPERDRIARWCDWLEDRIRRSDPIQSTALLIGFDDERDDRGWSTRATVETL